MDQTLKIMAAVLAVAAVACTAVLFFGSPATEDNGITGTETIYFFYGEECPHCHDIMPFVINMTEKYPDADIRLLEVWHNATNQRIYQDANTAAGWTRLGVPEVVIGRTVLSGERDIPIYFEALIQDYLKKKAR